MLFSALELPESPQWVRFKRSASPGLQSGKKKRKNSVEISVRLGEGSQHVKVLLKSSAMSALGPPARTTLQPEGGIWPCWPIWNSEVHLWPTTRVVFTNDFPLKCQTTVKHSNRIWPVANAKASGFQLRCCSAAKGSKLLNISHGKPSGMGCRLLLQRVCGSERNEWSPKGTSNQPSC